MKVDRERISEIERLRDEFSREATSAPRLFRDLAKMEEYIAESYRSRSFIELIQNADDAGSSSLGVFAGSDGFIVANDGRPFTIQDVESLCRSGSSTKRRGGDTIGYRGIGFKSVVNLATQVHVISGGFAFYFDKLETQKLLSSSEDVPLIRVPHVLPPAALQLELDNVMRTLGRTPYETVFIFRGLDPRLSLLTFLDFRRHALVFLKHLGLLEFRLPHTSVDLSRDIPKSIRNTYPAFTREGNEAIRAIRIDRSRQEHGSTVSITEGEFTDCWEVACSDSDPYTAVAFLTQGGEIVPAGLFEAVVHSFTPTEFESGAWLKINGDFTTDPSRMRVEMDDQSRAALSGAALILSRTIASTLTGLASKNGLFRVFATDKSANLRYRPQLNQLIAQHLHAAPWPFADGTALDSSKLRLCPAWLNYPDFERLCSGELWAVSERVMNSHPEAPSALREFGYKEFTLDEAIEQLRTTRLSPQGCAQIVLAALRQPQADRGYVTLVDKLTRVPLLPVNGQVVPFDQTRDEASLDQDFRDYLYENADRHEISVLLAELHIRPSSPEYELYGWAKTCPYSEDSEILVDDEDESRPPDMVLEGFVRFLSAQPCPATA